MLIAVVAGILMQTMRMVMLVRIAARWRLAALVNTRRSVAEILSVLNSLLARCYCLHLVLICVRRDYVAACFVFDRLTLDVGAMERNGLFEIIQSMLARAAVSSNLVVCSHSRVA